MEEDDDEKDNEENDGEEKEDNDDDDDDDEDEDVNDDEEENDEDDEDEKDDDEVEEDAEEMMMMMTIWVYGGSTLANTTDRTREESIPQNPSSPSLAKQKKCWPPQQCKNQLKWASRPLILPKQTELELGLPSIREFFKIPSFRTFPCHCQNCNGKFSLFNRGQVAYVRMLEYELPILDSFNLVRHVVQFWHGSNNRTSLKYISSGWTSNLS